MAMAKRFKLKLSSLQFCRSKHPSTFPENPTHRLSPLNPKAVDIGFRRLPAPPPSTPERTPRAAACGCRSGSCAQFLFSCGGGRAARSPEYTQVEPKPLRRVHCEPDPSTEFGSDRSIKKYERHEAKSKSKSKSKSKPKQIEISSSDWFSDEDNDGTALLSSFTIDSSYEFSSTTTTRSLETVGEKQRIVSGGVEWPEEEEDLGGATAAMKGKVRESFAVVKRSREPYEDFRRSMMEMIVEKKMVEAEELEQLLQCFLSLNSRSYHRVIVEAFSDIWELLFCDPSDDQ